MNPPAAQRQTDYSPATFIASLVNILVVMLAVWVFLPWLALLVVVLPLLLVDLALAVVLRSRQGRLGQVGQGMLIGLIAAPVAVVVFVLGLVIGQAAGIL
ncbi:hypothetical protein [Mycolicibacterium sp.]|uniref:hypothetical protein n=1 Tax=Mycolicibacterium sp. TaxID=2320850 RepID=UPI003D09EF75